MSNAQNIVMGGGVPAAKFETVGDRVSGRIIRIHDPRPATDPVTNKVKTWQDDTPIMQVAIELDNGTETGIMLYIQAGSERQRTLRDAVRGAGRKELEEGAHVDMTFTGTEPSTIAGAQPKKLFSAGYRPPEGTGSQALMNGQQQAAQSQYVQAPTQQQVQQSAPAYAQGGQSQQPVQNVPGGLDHFAPRQDATTSGPQQVDISHLPPEVQQLIQQHTQG